MFELCQTETSFISNCFQVDSNSKELKHPKPFGNRISNVNSYSDNPWLTLCRPPLQTDTPVYQDRSQSSAGAEK